MPSNWFSCFQSVPFQFDHITFLVRMLQSTPLFSKGMESALFAMNVKALDPPLFPSLALPLATPSSMSGVQSTLKFQFPKAPWHLTRISRALFFLPHLTLLLQWTDFPHNSGLSLDAPSSRRPPFSASED